ncbi:MAG TPA: c-type cytochrome [Balneolaceae bacterium]|nr:c-type cytochrome [Balneolaceae bacterium]
MAKKIIYLLLLASVLFMSCRGQKSEKPPVHPNLNMDFQNRFNAQEENEFFADNRAMRPPVEGTVARGLLKEDVEYYEGLNPDSSFVEDIPMEVTGSFIYRGQDRYDIYCSVCHGGTGDGRGIIMTGDYGYVPAPSFHSNRLREVPDGEIYSAIANGIRNMPSYATQIPVEDRWAIVSYVRALQRSQYIPEDQMQQFDVDLADLMQRYEEEQQALAQEREAAAAADAGAEVSASRGESLYTQYACNTCHSLDGSRLVGPSFQNLFGNDRPLEDGSVVTADEDYIYESITEPSAKVAEGYPNVMQPYDYLSESELQSLIEFIKAQSDN